jgi:competence protein ComEC
MDDEQSAPPELPAPLDPPCPDRFWHKAAGLNCVVMSAAPLGPIAIGIIVGIVAGERIGLGPVFFLLMLMAASLGAAFSLVRDCAGVVLVLAAGIGAGGVLHWSRERIVPTTSVEHILRQGETIIRVRGQIVSEPTIPIKDEGVFSLWQFREDQTAFLLRVESVQGEDDWRVASGAIRVTIREAVLDLAEGDSVELFGQSVALRPPQNPGAFDWRSYYRQQGVVARMYCDQRENIVRLGREGAGFASWLKAKTRGLLTDDIAASAAEEGSLLEAMVLGHRSRFDRRLNEVFTRAGCVHFIAASGTNIVVLMATVWFAGRLLGLDKRRCAWVMIVAIVLYGIVAEARPPILRACVMGLMFCLALLLQRATSHFNWICAAAIVLCLIDPMMDFDAGFQLSFAAVLGVAYLAPAIWQALKDSYWWFRLVALRDPYARADQHLRKVAERFAPLTFRQRFIRSSWKIVRFVAVICAVSVGAWLSGLPITALWFQRMQPWGVLSSVLVYPLMSIVMVLGLVKVGLAVISPTLAGAVTSALTAVDAVMIRLVEWMANLPAASPIISPPPWWLAASFYLFLFTFTLTFRSKQTAPSATGDDAAGPFVPDKNARSTFCVLASLALLAASSIAWHFDGEKGSRLSVTVLAVGSGTAIVMELPDGETILYDAGSLGVANAGKNVIAPFLRHRGIRRIDRLYVSHPNLDHFSGIPELIAEIPIGPILWNHCFESLAPPRSPAKKLVSHLKSLGHEADILGAHQIQWESDGVLFEKLWPPPGSCTNLTANDSSTVLRVSFAGRSILLTGDITDVAERALVRAANLHADVLLLPHHGSVRAGTGEFLKAVGADVLIRSSGQRLADTTNGLQKLIGGTTIYNTADCGAVTIVVDENGLRVEPWHTPFSD